MATEIKNANNSYWRPTTRFCLQKSPTTQLPYRGSNVGSGLFKHKNLSHKQAVKPPVNYVSKLKSNTLTHTYYFINLIT